MKNPKLFVFVLCTASAILLSLPWLVPHCGAFALFAFLPLLWADQAADEMKVNRFWLYHFYTFVLWNALTTFWVCFATVGGGIFAILANAFQMSVVWALFRLAKKRVGGSVAYLFLAVMWIAWERRYFAVDISWPWLVLGNAFADSTTSVQWYEYTGTLGGSLWIWACNLSFFGMLKARATGSFAVWNRLARSLSMLGVTLLVCGPLLLSKSMYFSYDGKSEGSVDVIIAQPNFDPYEKFESLGQDRQTAILLGLFEEEIARQGDSSRVRLLLAPETFTSDIILNDIDASATVRSMRRFLSDYPGSQILFGASTAELFDASDSPGILARPYGGGSYLSHNTALILGAGGPADLYHKSRLVVGVESTPYPRLFVPVDNWLSGMMGVSGLMGRCVPQEEAGVLRFGDGIGLGCAVCYESVYGEYCTGFVKAGADAMTVITNDAWWGNTPGYRQHLNYSRLRAIELRRDLARCGNTGISCFIDQRGDVTASTGWRERDVLAGSISLNSEQTFFVRNGDIVGRVCTLMFLLLAALLLARVVTGSRRLE